MMPRNAAERIRQRLRLIQPEDPEQQHARLMRLTPPFLVSLLFYIAASLVGSVASGAAGVTAGALATLLVALAAAGGFVASIAWASRREWLFAFLVLPVVLLAIAAYAALLRWLLPGALARSPLLALPPAALLVAALLALTRRAVGLAPPRAAGVNAAFRADPFILRATATLALHPVWSTLLAFYLAALLLSPIALPQPVEYGVFLAVLLFASGLSNRLARRYGVDEGAGP